MLLRMIGQLRALTERNGRTRLTVRAKYKMHRRPDMMTDHLDEAVTFLLQHPPCALHHSLTQAKTLFNSSVFNAITFICSELSRLYSRINIIEWILHWIYRECVGGCRGLQLSRDLLVTAKSEQSLLAECKRNMNFANWVTRQMNIASVFIHPHSVWSCVPVWVRPKETDTHVIKFIYKSAEKSHRNSEISSIINNGSAERTAHNFQTVWPFVECGPSGWLKWLLA